MSSRMVSGENVILCSTRLRWGPGLCKQGGLSAKYAAAEEILGSSDENEGRIYPPRRLVWLG